MKHGLQNEILRGAVVVLATFFLTAIIVGNIGKYYFLIWLIPLIVMLVYPVYIKLNIDHILDRNEVGKSSKDFTLKRKTAKFRILLVISVIISWSVIERYVRHIEPFHGLFGVIVCLIIGHYLISYYVKK